MALAEIDALFARQCEHALALGTRSISDRKRDLKKLRHGLLSHRSAIAAALAKDLNKPAIESDLSEIVPVKTEIDHALRSIDEWASKRHVSTPLSLFGTRAWVKTEPLEFSFQPHLWAVGIRISCRQLCDIEAI